MVMEASLASGAKRPRLHATPAVCSREWSASRDSASPCTNSPIPCPTSSPPPLAASSSSSSRSPDDRLLAAAAAMPTALPSTMLRLLRLLRLLALLLLLLLLLLLPRRVREGSLVEREAEDAVLDAPTELPLLPPSTNGDAGGGSVGARPASSFASAAASFLVRPVAASAGGRMGADRVARLLP